MLKEVEPWIWPRNSPFPSRPVGGSACAAWVCTDQSLSSLPSGKRAEPWGHGQCPSALLPTQQRELDPTSREGKKVACATTHNFVTWSFYWCASSEQGDAVSSLQFLTQMATGSGHQIKHRGLVLDYFFPVVHRTGSNRLGKPSTFFVFQ